MQRRAGASWMAPMIRRIFPPPRSAPWPRRARPRRPQGEHDHRHRRHEGQGQRLRPGRPALGRRHYSVKFGATVTLRDKSTMGQPHSLSLIAKKPKGDQGDHGVQGVRAADGSPRGQPGHHGSRQGHSSRPTGAAQRLSTFAAQLDLAAVEGQGHVQGHREEGRRSSTFVCAIHPWMLGEIKVSKGVQRTCSRKPGAYRESWRMSSTSCRCRRRRRLLAAFNCRSAGLAAGPHGADQRAAEPRVPATGSRIGRSGSARRAPGVRR